MEDFSDEGACLGKIVEEEVNASIVQLIRQYKFGIEMPRFYRKYDDEIKHLCNWTTSKKTIAFNFYDRSRNTLRTIPVGDVNACIPSLLEYSPQFAKELGVFSEAEYLNKTSLFSRYRNYSAHLGRFAKEEFEDMRQLFMEIIDLFMTPYCELKARLKGDGLNR